MHKSTSPTERFADKLAATSTTAEARSKHTTKATPLREKVNRTTLQSHKQRPIV